jgi:hypothetical protein
MRTECKLTGLSGSEIYEAAWMPWPADSELR